MAAISSASLPLSHTPPSRLALGQLIRISALWFGLEFFWISQQFIVMPERLKHFVPLAHVGGYYGLIKACGAVVVIATQLTVGFISDHSYSRLGRRRPFIIHGIVWGCAAIVFFIIAPTYWWLFAAYLLIEATINVASIPFQSLLPDLVPEQQHARAGALMGLMHMGGYLAGLCAIIALELVFAGRDITILGDVKPLGYLYLLATYLLILLGLAAVTVLGSDEQRWSQAVREPVSGALRSLRLLPGVVVKFVKTAPTLLGCILHDYRQVDLRGQPNFTWLAASRFMIYLGYQTFLTYLAYYVGANLDTASWLAGLGLGEKYAAVALPAILLFFIIGGFAGNLLSAPLAETHGKKLTILLGMVLAGAMVVPLIFTHNVWVAVGCGSLMGCGWGAFISADWAFACTLMPKQKAGSYMGIWDVTTLLPQVLAPVVAAPIRDSIYNARVAQFITQLGEQAGQRAAEASAHQWLYATIIVYFIVGLLLLRRVKEARAVQARQSAASPG